MIDGQNRRIGKKVNGVLVEGFLYRIARHSNIRLAVDTYGHLEVEDLREAMELLGEATGVLPDALEAEMLARTESLAPGPTGVHALPKRQKRRARAPGDS